MPEMHHITTTVHGRFLLSGSTARSAPLIVGCHGYGETAADHLAELEQIPGADTWRLCAVDALHPFYKKTGEVVRSWMTKEDRELAIDENVRYVVTVVDAIRRQHGVGHLVCSGFSQGVAMAYRAAARAGSPCHGIIALAGDVPPDVADLMSAAGRKLPPVLVGRGRNDKWYDEAKMQADVDLLEPLAERVDTCVFDAGHVWHDDFYAACGDFLQRV